MKIKQFTHRNLLLMLVISLFVACSKEKGGVTPNTLLKLDKVTSSDGTYRNHTYDEKSRLIRQDYKDFYITYNYNGNTVIETLQYFDPTKSGSIYTHTLNAQGLASSYTEKLGNFSYLTEIEYDTNGRYVKKTYKNTTLLSTGTIMYEYYYNYDNDGDLTNVEYKSISYPSSNYSIQYTFDKNHYNTTGSEFSGLAWKGKGSLHVLTKVILTYIDGRKTTTDYQFVYDAKNYVSQMTTIATDGTKVTTLTYNFTYK